MYLAPLASLCKNHHPNITPRRSLASLQPRWSEHGAIYDHLSREMVGFRPIGQHFGDEAAVGFFQDVVSDLQFGEFDPDFFEG